MHKIELLQYLQPKKYLDSDNSAVILYTNQITENETNPINKAIKLYYRIRDDFNYNPYNINLSPEAFKASNLLKKNYGYCIEKAALLAACSKVIGIPSRLGFAIVKNHIGTEKIEKILKTNELVFHGYTELYLNKKWVKATPAFNKGLCEKLNVKPLEFDGTYDSVFQEYNQTNNKFMDYIHDYGQFNDIPYNYIIKELKNHYSHLFDKNGNSLYPDVFYFSK